MLQFEDMTIDTNNDTYQNNSSFRNFVNYLEKFRLFRALLLTHFLFLSLGCCNPFSLKEFGNNKCTANLTVQVPRLNVKYVRRKFCRAVLLKFIYPEKATKFCEIFTLLLTGTP